MKKILATLLFCAAQLCHAADVPFNTWASTNSGFLTTLRTRGFVEITNGTAKGTWTFTNTTHGTSVTIGTNGAATFSGSVTAASFIGDGSGLTGVIATNSPVQKAVVTSVPAVLYAVASNQFNHYFDGAIRTPIPLANYRVQATSTGATQYQDFVRHYPANSQAGTNSFGYTVWLETNLLATYSGSLVISSNLSTNVVIQSQGDTETVPQASSSTFSGWGQPLGIISNQFNAVRIPFYTWNTNLPTSIEVTIKIQGSEFSTNINTALQGATNPSTWTTVLTATNTVSFTQGTTNWETFRFASNIYSTSNLWLHFRANGNTASLRVTGVPSALSNANDYAISSYATGGSLSGTNWTTSSTTNTINLFQTIFEVFPVRKLLVIGDSTTSGGYTVARANSNCWESGYQLTPIGTQGSGTNKHEGRSGWTAAMFYSGNTSPFTNAGAFDFNFYLTNNSLTMERNDWVMFNLGINDMFSYTNDATALTAITNFLSTVSNMVVNIQATVPGVRVGLCVPIPPSQSQDAFGANYGTDYYQSRYRRHRFLLAEKIAQYSLTGLKIVPISTALDTLYNMNTTTAAVNSRNATTRSYQSNGVHPDVSGYDQIGDAIFWFLKGQVPQ